MDKFQEEQCVIVVNKHGKQLNMCTQKRAKKLVDRRRAIWVKSNTIKLIVNKYDKKKIRDKVMSKADRICYICNTKISEDQPLTIDHVIPKSINGRDTITNYQCCCKRCNDDKADRDLLGYSIHIVKNRPQYGYLSNERLAYLIELGIIYRQKNVRGGSNEKNSLPAQSYCS